MPLYEYICKDCSKKFEKILSFNSSAPACPFCGSNNTHKQISNFQAKSDTGRNITGNSCSSCSKGTCSTCQ